MVKKPDSTRIARNRDWPILTPEELTKIREAAKAAAAKAPRKIASAAERLKAH